MRWRVGQLHTEETKPVRKWKGKAAYSVVTLWCEGVIAAEARPSSSISDAVVKCVDHKHSQKEGLV